MQCFENQIGHRTGEISRLWFNRFKSFESKEIAVKPLKKSKPQMITFHGLTD